MTISDEILRLQNAKSSIRTSIENKGVTVGDDAKLDEYPALIDSISGGGGSETQYEYPNYFEIVTNGGTNFTELFKGYDGSTLDLSNLDVTRATKVVDMFYNCSEEVTGYENWKFNSLTDATRMFYNFDNNKKYMDLSKIDFSKVKTVNYMFNNADIDYLDVRNLKLPSCSQYNRLFEYAIGTKLDLTKWDISEVEDLTYLLHYCKVKEVDLTGWDTSHITVMNYMFYNTSEVQKIIAPNLVISDGCSINYLFNSYCPKHMVFSNVDNNTMTKIIGKLSTKENTEGYKIEVRPDLPQDIIDSLANKGYKPVGPTFDLTGGSLGLELTELLPNGKTAGGIIGMTPWYFDPIYSENVQLISSNESVITVNGNKLLSTGQIGSSDITLKRLSDGAIIGEPATLTVSATDSNPNQIKFRIAGTPAGTTNVLYINGGNVKLNQCTKDALGIYTYTCSSQITSIDITPSSSCFIADLVKFNLNASGITKLTGAFANYRGTYIDISLWDTSHITDFSTVFHGAGSLKKIDGVIDMSNAKLSNGNYMFYQCPELEEVYLKNIYKNCTMDNKSAWAIDFATTKVKDECLVYIINELPNLYDKGLTLMNNVKLYLPKSNTLTEEQVQVAVDKGWTIVNANY